MTPTNLADPLKGIFGYPKFALRQTLSLMDIIVILYEFKLFNTTVNIIAMIYKI